MHAFLNKYVKKIEKNFPKFLNKDEKSKNN